MDLLCSFINSVVSIITGKYPSPKKMKYIERSSYGGTVEQIWQNTGTVIVEKWNNDGGTEEHRWWKRGTEEQIWGNSGTMEQ